MRATTLLLENTRVLVLDVELDDKGLVSDGGPTWFLGRCSDCGDVAPGYDRGRGWRWRRLDFAGILVHLRYDARRVDCERCGVTVE